MIGREAQVIKMKELLSSNKSEFIAVTGRRRVGKTYLIENVYKKHICFAITGIQKGSMDEQLLNFRIKLSQYSKTPILSTPQSWQEAFQQLKHYLNSLSKKTKKIIFIDELPWMYTPRSKFTQMLAHLWNDYLSKENHFVLVVCGSATSWIIKKIVNDKGGLHNRLSDIIRLLPFTLAETNLFLKSKGIKLTEQEITKIYMALGGVPFYLEKIRRGESATTAIERLCFSEDGILKNEYDNLYKALFVNPEKHEAIITILALSKGGLTRERILNKIKAKGSYHRTMEDLLHSGFVSEHHPFGGKKHGAIYKLNDEYSVFYHKFIKPNKRSSKGIWSQISATQSYKIWVGYAFESICHKHTAQIKNCLGISGIYTDISALNVKGTVGQKGFQIDLIIDRKDAVVNLCEIKYSEHPFTITKLYAQKLNTRRQEFIARTKTRKQVFNTLISNHQIVQNKYSLEVMDSEITLKYLFK